VAPLAATGFDAVVGPASRSIVTVAATAMGWIVLAAALILVIGGMAVFDLLALRYGVDSREGLGDDRRRTLRN
jgi:hypothetical protein